ncbi:hypothetical protein TRFO_08434 [Tritrichomonas foetus]|uniref:Uncharacterized protein n=1 Tax=Tritrichomonas foetus TaxID=1144522 RepID=A0A1J4JLD2_9EUKA|nr:hypothetical protein TRFO_08434 [Tritrichomonas foetus]|eukprot:OHS99481.1 hypothetical protein TRFO_08434 [Tritrichomonas foetus]
MERITSNISDHMQDRLVQKEFHARALEQNQPFNSIIAKQDLEMNLQLLHDFIVGMSKICVDRVTAINEKLEKYESEVRETDGLLTVIKDSTGTMFLEQLSQDVKPELLPNKIPEVNNEMTEIPPFQFPGNGYTINMRTLDRLGAKVENMSKHMLPLIIPVVNGNNRQPLWGKLDDYFVRFNK